MYSQPYNNRQGGYDGKVSPGQERGSVFGRLGPQGDSSSSRDRGSIRMSRGGGGGGGQRPGGSSWHKVTVRHLL